MVPNIKIFIILLCLLAVGLLYRVTIKGKAFNIKDFRTLIFSAKITPERILYSGNGIMFVETEKMDLPHYVLCSIESAARVNPDRPVAFFMKGLTDINSKEDEDRARMSYPTLLPYDNIYFFPLTMNVLLNNTPLMHWYQKVNPKSGEYRNPVILDACKLALIYKYGGIYMDTDIITLRPVPEQNFLAAEESQLSTTAVFAFDRHQMIILQFMQEFVKSYDVTAWAQQGPFLFTRILNQFYCKVPPFKGKEDLKCGTILFLNTERFFPISRLEWKRFFEVKEKHPTFNNSYALNTFSYANRKENTMMVPGSNTLMEHIYKKHCPITYHAVLEKKTLYHKFGP
ncbi:alpha-1,4-N-acetylglucosaminyltransferase [Xenopus laevis]|uniref:Alpha-1,4-N-acetylglucosaminyltransferase n=2 Tax=Xenopus laevis TaxID=8355 RepID=A0A1L8G511_XENLA|nr:alpha-1,4-N-acetylglucosaminyltransferase [Xenopus laevis]OCT78906.1 hypothetical protein XELAEV_18029995mg [Xenopus laevis]